jgi:hypothetical protein
VDDIRRITTSTQFFSKRRQLGFLSEELPEANSSSASERYHDFVAVKTEQTKPAGKP